MLRELVCRWLSRGVVWGGVSGVASAGALPVTLSVDPAQSTVTATLCFSGMTLCDTDSSPASGTVEVEIDSAMAPGELAIAGFDIQLDETISLNLSLGILGMFTSSASDIRLVDALLMPTLPAPVVADAFVVADVPTQPLGMVSYNATGLFCTALGGLTPPLPCAGMLDLSTFGPTNGDIPGVITSSPAMGGRTLTLTLELNQTSFFDPNDPSVGTLTLEGTVVATAFVPDAPAPCDGDVDGNDMVNIDDITFVVLRLGNMGMPGGSLAGDADGNGVVNIDDITYVVLRLGMPCP